MKSLSGAPKPTIVARPLVGFGALSCAHIEHRAWRLNPPYAFFFSGRTSSQKANRPANDWAKTIQANGAAFAAPAIG